MIKKKRSFFPIILPDLAILDPLTLGLPPHTTAATGIDAMVHAIESYASKVKIIIDFKEFSKRSLKFNR